MEAGPSGRADGRGLEEFRKPFLKTGVLSQARGSAYAEFANSKLMVGVYGPRQNEVRLGFTETGRLNCEVKFTTFASLKLSKMEQGQAEGAMAAALQQALEASVQLQKFPKAVFDVYAMVLESGGSDLAVAISTASLALASAGIEMFDLVPAATVAKQQGLLLLDPTLEESAHDIGNGGGSMTLAMMPSLNEITYMSVRGVWSNAETRDAMELLMGACTELRSEMRNTLLPVD